MYSSSLGKIITHSLPFCSSTNNRYILEETDDQFVFPTGSLIPDVDNVVTIVQVRGHALTRPLLNHAILQDNMGLNQTDGSRSDHIFFRTPFESQSKV